MRIHDHAAYIAYVAEKVLGQFSLTIARWFSEVFRMPGDTTKRGAVMNGVLGHDLLERADTVVQRQRRHYALEIKVVGRPLRRSKFIAKGRADEWLAR